MQNWTSEAVARSAARNRSVVFVVVLMRPPRRSQFRVLDQARRRRATPLLPVQLVPRPPLLGLVPERLGELLLLTITWRRLLVFIERPAECYYHDAPPPEIPGSSQKSWTNRAWISWISGSPAAQRWDSRTSQETGVPTMPPQK